MRAAIVVSVVFLLSGSPVSAETFLVAPDGTGDFPTIQDAIDTSISGDVILLSEGTFRGTGNRDLDYGGKAITIRSESGNPESCGIDCEGSEGDPHRCFYFRSGEGAGSVVEGVTITGGYTVVQSSYGGGVRCDGTSPTLRNCAFEGNYARGEGGGFESGNGSPALIRCHFSDNEAEGYGGGAYIGGGSATVIGCTFEDNLAFVGGGLACDGGQTQVTRCSFIENRALSGGGLKCFGGTASITGCMFIKNVTALGGSAVFCNGGSPEFDQCTFLMNDTGDSGAVHCWSGVDASIHRSTFCGNQGYYDASDIRLDQDSHLTIENSIIAFGRTGWPIRCSGQSTATLSCCDVFGNEFGDWTWCIEGQLGVRGNISADPLFCNAEHGDLGLASDSPCAAENNPECQLIGAWLVACGPTAVMRTSWGGLKAMFRR